MLWIESPAGVGWSTATGPNDMNQNDMLQSQDKDVQPKGVYPVPCAADNPTVIPQGLHPADQDVVIPSKEIDDDL